MSAQTGFTLPVLGGAEPVYADIRTSPCTALSPETAHNQNQGATTGRREENVEYVATLEL